MDYSAASSYIYAKASGIIKKSFVGKNVYKLFSVKSLVELWELVFNTSAPVIPEVLLANKIETEAVKRFVSNYIHLVESYSKPDKIFLELLHRYEIENLKMLSSALALNEEKMPRIVDLGKYNVLNYKGWPNLQEITKDSPYAWYNEVADIKNQQKLAYKLDLQEFNILWNAINSVSDGTKKVLLDFFREDYSLKNMLWALRLKVYYNMSNEEIINELFYVGKAPCATDPLCSVAFEILDFKIDSYDDWANWKYSRFINPLEEGTPWKIDPMWVESQIKKEDHKKNIKMFHSYPLTNVPLVMFFRIKQEEVYSIRAAVESLRLGVDAKDYFESAGISAE